MKNLFATRPRFITPLFVFSRSCVVAFCCGVLGKNKEKKLIPIDVSFSLSSSPFFLQIISLPPRRTLDTNNFPRIMICHVATWEGGGENDCQRTKILWNCIQPHRDSTKLLLPPSNSFTCFKSWQFRHRRAFFTSEPVLNWRENVETRDFFFLCRNFSFPEKKYSWRKAAEWSIYVEDWVLLGCSQNLMKLLGKRMLFKRIWKRYKDMGQG